MGIDLMITGRAIVHTQFLRSNVLLVSPSRNDTQPLDDDSMLLTAGCKAKRAPYTYGKRSKPEEKLHIRGKLAAKKTSRWHCEATRKLHCCKKWQCL